MIHMYIPIYILNTRKTVCVKRISQLLFFTDTKSKNTWLSHSRNIYNLGRSALLAALMTPVELPPPLPPPAGTSGSTVSNGAS